MDFPGGLQYTKDHEWIQLEDGTATIGVTEFAIEQLGDIVHLDLPEVGAEFESGDTFGTIESTKTVSDLYIPLTGVVTAINDQLQDKLESLGEDPYKSGWLVKVKTSGSTSSDELLSAEKYEAFIKEQD